MGGRKKIKPGKRGMQMWNGPFRTKMRPSTKKDVPEEVDEIIPDSNNLEAD